MSILLKNEDYLNESPSDLDSLDYSDEAMRVSKRIENAINTKKNKIIAYIGAFGIGKSSVLKKSYKNLNEKGVNMKWIDFETWRYSERSDLWDAFVIKVASELSLIKSEHYHASLIDGKRLYVMQYLKLLLIFAIIFIFLTWMSYITWNWFYLDGMFAEAFLKYALPTVISVLLVIGLTRLIKVSDDRPLTRVFELEALLNRQIKKYKDPIVIVLEDVDRSGESGAVFMETLHEFFNKNKYKSAVIAIAPQSNASFDATTENRVRDIERSLKVYDEKMYFSSQITRESLKSFYSNIEYKKKFYNFAPAMEEITWEFVYYYRNQLTIRMLKHALREVVWYIEANPKSNPAIVLIFSISRILKVNGSNKSTVLKQISRTLNDRFDISNDGEKHTINENNLLVACFAIAACQDTKVGVPSLLNSNGRFNQLTTIARIDVRFDSEMVDSAEIIDNKTMRRVELSLSLRKKYKEDLSE